MIGNPQFCLSKVWNTTLPAGSSFTQFWRDAQETHLKPDELGALASTDAELQMKQGTLFLSGDW